MDHSKLAIPIIADPTPQLWSHMCAMHEVLTESIRWVNLPFTVLLGFVVIYWLMVGLGVLDMSLFGDFDADFHVDGHFDAHAHVDTDVGDHPLVPGDPAGLNSGEVHGIHKEIAGGHNGSFLVQALSFLNVGQVPLTLVLSVLALCLWLGSMIANRYFTGGSVALATAALVPNLVLSVIATRYITLPFRPLFRAITRERNEDFVVIGQRCTIVTSEATPEFGQAEIKTDGAPLLLNVRTLNDSLLARGDTAVVVRVDKDRSLYFITPLPKPSPTH
jgi:hypothetical protein